MKLAGRAVLDEVGLDNIFRQKFKLSANYKLISKRPVKLLFLKDFPINSDLALLKLENQIGIFSEENIIETAARK